MPRIVTFKIDEPLLEVLDKYAQSRGMSRSEVIRKAIVKLLESEGITIEDVGREPANDGRSIVIEVVV